jgi:RNA polymerase sigma-70 factor (ECF subfamily)
MENLYESQILEECILGNWTNFEELYEEYLPKIYRYVYHRVGNKQLAEDVTSTVFMKVVSNLNTFRVGESSFASWIYAIARNTLIDHFRKHKSTVDLGEADNIASTQNVEHQTDTTLTLAKVKTAMKNLSEVQREVLILRAWDDLSHKEIGEVLGISEDNSKMTFSRALKSLKQIVNVGEIL